MIHQYFRHPCERFEHKRIRGFSGANAEVKLFSMNFFINFRKQIIRICKHGQKRIVQVILKKTIVAVIETAISKIDHKVVTADHAVRARAEGHELTWKRIEQQSVFVFYVSVFSEVI
jgi:hypothetical protein